MPEYAFYDAFCSAINYLNKIIN